LVVVLFGIDKKHKLNLNKFFIIRVGRKRSLIINCRNTTVMYSDGITEALNEKGERVRPGTADPIDFDNRGLPSGELMQRIIQGAKDFSKPWPRKMT